MEVWRRLILPELSSATDTTLQAYLVGAAGDACFNRQHNTTRFSQKDRLWLEVLGLALDRLGHRSWSYQEGKRDVHVLETSWSDDGLLVREASDVAAFIRGFFDAEGGIPRSSEARFYIQLTQKSKRELGQLRLLCLDFGLHCGRMHNPSVRVDPDYWRFYIAVRSQRRFIQTVGSWHPRKRLLLEERLANRSKSR